MKTYYFFVIVRIQCGNYSFNSKSVTKGFINESADIEEIKKEIARNTAMEFFDKNKTYDDEAPFFFYGGEVATETTDVVEISEDEYKVFEKYGMDWFTDK